MKKVANTVKILPWDTQFFGYTIARVHAIILHAKDVSQVFENCKQLGVECLYVTLEGKRSADLAKRNRFSFVGERYTYALQSQRLRMHQTSSVTVRRGTKNDLSALFKLSEALSKESRFSRDVRFGSAAARRLYREWTRKLVFDTRRSTRVFVAASRYRVAGFVAASVKKGIVHVELVVVDPAFRGKGVGGTLMDVCVASYKKSGYKKFKVVTQGTNIAAQRLYESCGFRLVKVTRDYHKWFI